MKIHRKLNQDLHLNITPLIDVVFLLVIFFMVTTNFSNNSQLSLNLATADGTDYTNKSQQIELIIDSVGNYYINNQPLTTNDIRALKYAVLQRSHSNSDIPFVITGDAQAPHQFIIRAIDVAEQLGFTKVSLKTANIHN